jgi:hypothetical protein
VPDARKKKNLVPDERWEERIDRKSPTPTRLARASRVPPAPPMPEHVIRRRLRDGVHTDGSRQHDETPLLCCYSSCSVVASSDDPDSGVGPTTGWPEAAGSPAPEWPKRGWRRRVSHELVATPRDWSSRGDEQRSLGSFFYQQGHYSLF